MKYIAFAVAIIVAVVVYFLFFKQESYESAFKDFDPKNNDNDGRIANYFSQLQNAKTEEEKAELTENWSHFIDPGQFTANQKIVLKKIEDKLLE